MDGKWYALGRACEPSNERAASMVDELYAVFGRPAACMVLGMSAMTIEQWRRRRRMSRGAKRGVFMVWAFFLHPEKLRSGWDVVTWGQFSDHRERVGKKLRELTPQETKRKAA